MTDLRKFSGRIKILAKRVEENSNALVRKVALAVDSTVVLATPVDTGRARSNWQVSIGDWTPTSVIPPYAPGEKRNTEAANTNAALEQGKAEIAKYKGQGMIHITNNLPYIGRLNDGHSAQAPSGFVEKAVLVGVSAAQGAGSLLQKAFNEEL